LTEHHDGCFGCGQTNLFGLQLEAGRAEGAPLRFFVKQDHQGPLGVAHPGILATALVEALGTDIGRVDVTFRGPAPVGTFVEIEVQDGRATARVEGEVVAEAEADSAVG
jgi:acyl-coenzyme A thioesterase PaaI-like protein